MSTKQISAIGIAHRCEEYAGFRMARAAFHATNHDDFLASVMLESAKEWAMHAALMREWSYHAMDVRSHFGVDTSADETAWDGWNIGSNGCEF